MIYMKKKKKIEKINKTIIMKIIKKQKKIKIWKKVRKKKIMKMKIKII